ncbi:alanine dehydrogenase [Candidatus Paracaedibacter symbiosus]|uniref:alanine dehydrogenase n=1 Tax=Candidatus Paracaedibacter symbiosus TaxID=244582 RepID=UPI00050940CF|nr:alanine dehydrogenase [Candidatus Paracaedibacter symbiosus]
MKIGIPKEIKVHEYRVGMTPTSVRELTRLGHQIIVESNIGLGIGFDDKAYENAGATITATADLIFAEAEMIVKVKEPQPSECKKLRSGQLLFTYLHLAPDPKQTQGLIDSDCIAIAYETVTDRFGGLPLLAPMSEVAGRMSIQAGATFLEKGNGGCGILLGGVAGVSPAKVVILGGGVVGANAAKMAVGLGAQVTVFDKNPRRLNEVDWLFGSRVQTLYSTYDMIEKHVIDADLVIGAVLVMGAAAPELVTHAMVQNMRAGSVMVDVAIDQGGCFETSRPTTHADPTYIVDDVVHYCVTNMPGAVAKTSTVALNNATLPFIIALAEKGYMKALQEDEHLRQGLNIFKGKVTHQAVANDLNLPYAAAAQVLGA